MTMNAECIWTTTTLKVRYAETDQMGVVYYANYLIWFEIGRTDFCYQHGFAYREMERQDGLYIMVAEARCRYKAPARYDDEILVRTCLKEIRRRVLIFGYEVYRNPDDELLAEGETVHVITDREGHPRSLPEKYRELFVAGPKNLGHGVRDKGHGLRDSGYGTRDTGHGTRATAYGDRDDAAHEIRVPGPEDADLANGPRREIKRDESEN